MNQDNSLEKKLIDGGNVSIEPKRNFAPKYLTLAALAALTLSSCSDDLERIPTNPDLGIELYSDNLNQRHKLVYHEGNFTKTVEFVMNNQQYDTLGKLNLDNVTIDFSSYVVEEKIPKSKAKKVNRKQGDYLPLEQEIEFIGNGVENAYHSSSNYFKNLFKKKKKTTTYNPNHIAHKAIFDAFGQRIMDDIKFIYDNAEQINKPKNNTEKKYQNTNDGLNHLPQKTYTQRTTNK
jgi:hypothetical protein